MLEKPRLINILRNDSWTTTTLGSAVFMAVITAIVQIVNWATGMELSDVGNYLTITGVTFAIAAVFVPIRIKYVLDVFENGVETKASVVSTKVHKANMKLTLKYNFNGVDSQKTLDQVITGHTKRFLEEKEVVLVIDQYNPNRILLRDVYF
jgi:hypothetical protein